MSNQRIIKRLARPFQQFIRLDSASGILLIFAAVAALFIANSPLAQGYFDFWDIPVSLSIGRFTLSKPLLLWVNDGLMAIFFFIIGLEIKREVLAGELSSFQQAVMPMLAAVGGVVLPILIFFLLNGDPARNDGWGIPVATDIAFSLGVLSLLGSKVPLEMKVFLTAFAIVDDIIAVLIIALFYGHDIHWNFLAYAGGLMALLLTLNLFFNVMRNWPYLVVGSFLWLFVLKSGIHPTIAGVLVAFTIPARNQVGFRRLVERFDRYRKRMLSKSEESENPFLDEERLEAIHQIKSDLKGFQAPSQRLEYRLDNFVAFFVMPVFAFANAGIALTGGAGVLTAPFTLTIAIALVAGKTLGIFGFTWLGVKAGIASLPANVKWVHLVGLGLLGGIGFTMALFIANLAVEEETLLRQAKLGILLASAVAGLAGYFLLDFTLKYDYQKQDAEAEKAKAASSEKAVRTEQ